MTATRFPERASGPAERMAGFLAHLRMNGYRTGPAETADALAVQAARVSGGEAYNLVAMQVPHDYQIRGSSDYDDYGDMLREILESMARAAPPDRRLVMKMHPLDQGYKGYRESIPQWTRELGLEGRVDLIRGGDLGAHGLDIRRGLAAFVRAHLPQRL